MSNCKKCGLCCQYICIDLDTVDFDLRWAEGRDAMIVGRYAFISSQCKYLVNNLCILQENKPKWCKKFPEENEDWLDAMGCRYFREEVGE